VNRRTHIVVGTAAGTTVTVSRTGEPGPRPQGLVFEADEPLIVEELRSTRVVLWDHCAPAEVTLHTTGAGEVRIWHVWQDGDLIQAWIRDAGIELDDSGGDLALRCYDAHPGSDPDLEARIGFDRAWTQPADGADRPNGAVT
jgi:hypothetical protein